MGTVGVNGKITFRNFNQACLLYMSVNGDVITYNNGFCLFPIVAAAVVAVISLIFMIIWIVLVHRNDEFAPKPVSITLLVFSALLALLSFAICGEIGIGLNKGCQILGPDSHCRSTKNFNAIYGAEISAGIMGGLWLVTMLLELFQLRSKPPRLSTNFDYMNPPTVVPHRAGDKTSIEHLRDSGHGYYDSNVGAASSSTPTTSHVQKTEYHPETDTHAHGATTQDYQHHDGQQTTLATQAQATQNSAHPADASGVSYSTF
ncbi:hypothetical protein BGX28_001814 [Mortierella sp. GBA30]|nr:hypothetical protein BGX28_001814 [Mortierella sp. GBA30]